MVRSARLSRGGLSGAAPGRWGRSGCGLCFSMRGAQSLHVARRQDRVLDPPAPAWTRRSPQPRVAHPPGWRRPPSTSGPLPDMAAKRQSAWAASSALISAIAGRSRWPRAPGRCRARACSPAVPTDRRAPAERALRRRGGAPGRSSGPQIRGRRQRHARVDEYGVGPRQMPQRRACVSPFPQTRAGRSARHTGTSAPSRAAISSQGTPSARPALARRTARRSAAASAEPPPRPAATGQVFLKMHRAEAKAGSASRSSASVRVEQVLADDGSAQTGRSRQRVALRPAPASPHRGRRRR